MIMRSSTLLELRDIARLDVCAGQRLDHFSHRVPLSIPVCRFRLSPMIITTTGKESLMSTDKRCPRCTRILPASEFSPDRNRRDGLHSRCRECDCVASRRYYEANRAAVLARQRAQKEAARRLADSER